MIKKFSDIYNYKNKIALKSINHSISFKDLFKLSKTIPDELNKDCLVILITENKIEIIALYVILLTLRCKIMFLNYDNKNNNLIFDKYKPHFIINSKRSLDGYYEFHKFFKEINIFKRKEKFKYKINQNIKILLPTSGTTGDPKFVKLSKTNIISNSIGIIDSLKINNKSYPITTMPLSYSYGMSIVNSHIFKGYKIFISSKNIFESSFWKDVRENKISTFGGVPFFYEMLLKSNFKNIKNSSIKYLTQAGGTMDINVLNNLRKILNKKSINFYMMYGQTEATARISAKSCDKNFDLTIGDQIKGTKIFIKNKEIRNSKINLCGEISIKGKGIFKGYAYNFKDLAKVQNIKVLKTGDIGSYNPKDGISIIGRKKRISKIYGKRINLDSLEKIFTSNDKKAYIKSNDKCLFIHSSSLKKFEIENIFKENSIELPYKLIKVKKIPLKSNGKIDYTKL